MKRTFRSSPWVAKLLTHSAVNSRYYRHPEHNVRLGWIVIITITGLMGAGLGLSIGGSLQIYQGEGTPEDLSHWKVGTGLVVAVWAMEVMWALFSLLPSQCNKGAPGYKDGTKVCDSMNE